MSATDYTLRYLAETQKIVAGVDPGKLDRMVRLLRNLRDGGGRLFFLGVGGGAAHASHAVNDFRKIAGIESYSPSDNVAELTARVNDQGWKTTYSEWLRGSRLCSKDALFVFSVGGGDLDKDISANIVASLQLAKEVGAGILGIVGRDGGYTAKVGDEVLVIPAFAPDTVTPHTEGLQAVLWHCIVSHPELKLNEMKWESEK